MLVQNPSFRIFPEILLEHPILFTYEQKNLIINYSDHKFQLSEFRIERSLGEGAFGSCDLAIFIPTGEPVVLKQTMHKNTCEIEANIMKAMFHPNCCQLYGSF